LLHDRLDAVADHRARVGLGCVLDRPLVVVNEEAAHVDEAHLVLPLQELDGARNRVARAAAQLALVLDRRAEGSQVRARRQSRRNRLDGAVQDVPLIRQIRNPTVAGRLGLPLRRPPLRPWRASCPSGAAPAPSAVPPPPPAGVPAASRGCCGRDSSPWPLRCPGLELSPCWTTRYR